MPSVNTAFTINSFPSDENLAPATVDISLNSDGLLPVYALTHPVTVNFPVWDAVVINTSYQLLWDRNPVGIAKLIQATDNPGDILTLEIPVTALTNGSHRLAYRLVNLENGVQSDSPAIPIEIDRTAPGNPLLAPIIFPPAIQDGLTSDELEAMANVLPGEIASYHGMKEGDVVRSYWGAVEGPVAVVDKDDMGLKRVMVDFTRAFLESVGDVQASVYYTVTDLAGNVSMEAQAVPVSLQLQVLPVLPLPVVREAIGDTLDPVDTVNGATVVIGASAQLRSGDRVVVQWTGPKGSDSKEKVITDAQAGKDLALVFSAALVEVNKGQTVAIIYTVHHENGNEQTSPTLSLRIQASQPQLPAPSLDNVGPDGVLTPSKIPDSGATVRVAYAGMSPGDSVLVNWKGATAYDTPAQVIGGNVELQFNVPKAFINQSIGGSASVTYTVTRSGTAQVSTPLWLQVKQGLDFDPSPVTLSGKIYLLISYPDLLPAFPPNTTVQRGASGGQAPYTYGSSDALVAQVDENGLTSVRGNGTATITVTDALGETSGYQVTVTGVIHCLGFGGGKLAEISAKAADAGARVPAIGELNEIFNAYGNRWPMGHGLYWSSTVAAANIAGMKWYFVKNLNTGANAKLLEHNVSLGIGIR